MTGGGARRLGREPDGARGLWRRYQDAVRAAALPTAPRTDSATATRILRGFAFLYRPAGPSRPDLAEALRGGIPRLLRAEMRWVGWAASVYAVVAVCAAIAAALSPAWQAVLLPAAVRAALAASLRSGLHPAHAAAASLSVMLFFHNITASALAYAGGVLLGLGAVAALALNAALLGALAGWMAAHGVVAGFWALIAPHGALELPATFCAGGGGLAMGAAWLAPGDRPRLAALFAAARRTAPLFAAAVVLLAGAALVEGLFTPQPLPVPLKLGAAAALLLALAGYVLRAGSTPRPDRRDARRDPSAGPASALAPLDAPHGPLRARLHPVTRATSAGDPALPTLPPHPSGLGVAGGGELAIRLPEGLVVRAQRAGVPSRAVAMAVDTSILGVALLGTLAGIGLLRPRAPAGWVTAAGAVFGAAFFGLYGFLFEWLGEGATPGKRALGLRVLRDDGRPPGPWGALARNLLRVVDFLPAAYVLGAGVALTTGGARLGDWAGGTVVVHVGGRSAPAHCAAAPLPGWRGAAPEPGSLLRIPGRARSRLYRAWARWCRYRDPHSLAGLRSALRRAAIAPAPGSEAGAAEHLLAALHRSGLMRGRRFAPVPPRDRSGDLGPLCPGPGALEQLPPELAASVQAFWERRAAMDGPAVAELARSLAGRLAAGLGAPALGRDDPEALVEHVAHALRGPVDCTQRGERPGRRPL